MPPPTVVYDACVLYPSTLRDLLIRLAQSGLLRARWTDRILDEVFSNLKSDRPDLDPQKLDRTRHLMNRAVRDCLVSDYDRFIELIDLPDPGDRHVLAAAVRSDAQLIVTRNVKDFPETALERWGVAARDPDEVVLEIVDREPQRVRDAVQQIAVAWRNPPGNPSDVMKRLEVDGLVKSVAALRC